MDTVLTIVAIVVIAYGFMIFLRAWVVHRVLGEWPHQSEAARNLFREIG